MKITKLKTILILLFAFDSLFAQQFEFQDAIGKFRQASSFYISASGIIYVTDAANDQIYSLDTLGNILKTTGGYGWNESAFDEPVDVFATPLNVYVTDKNNHRIQRFDRDLNFISFLSTKDGENKEAGFGYPLSCSVSNQGDMYILDSENQRILKFDLFGNFIQNFGGFDAGIYQLKNPRAIAVNSRNLIVALDESGLVIFDAFGNGIGKIALDEDLISLRIIFDNLVINSSDKIFILDPRSDGDQLKEIEVDTEFKDLVSSLIYNDKLYILTAKEILIFSANNI